MKTKAFWIGACLLMLSACGPLIGGMMVANDGVKDFKVLQGSLADLTAGSRVAILGPFDKTPEAFYICRGEEAAAFTSAFNMSGLFSAELEINSRFPEELPQAHQFKGRTRVELQKTLDLKNLPDLIMSGTILRREMVAAPSNGIIMTVAYRLEFLNLVDGRTTILEVTTRELFQDAVPKTVEYMAKQMGAR